MDAAFVDLEKRLVLVQSTVILPDPSYHVPKLETALDTPRASLGGFTPEKFYLRVFGLPDEVCDYVCRYHYMLTVVCQTETLLVYAYPIVQAPKKKAKCPCYVYSGFGASDKLRYSELFVNVMLDKAESRKRRGKCAPIDSAHSYFLFSFRQS